MSHRHVLTPTEVGALGTVGYFTRPSFFGDTLARAVRAQAAGIGLRQAGVRRAGALDPSIRTDELAWLTAGETTGALREAVGAFSELMEQVNAAAWLGLRSFDLQLARYGPGGRYVRHRDAFPGQENRRLTAIVYLNEGWGPADGGVLRLFVEPEVLIEPTLDRLVVFRSEVVEHEVLEARAERWALTAWYQARLA